MKRETTIEANSEFCAPEEHEILNEECWKEQECPECLCAFGTDETICPNCGLELEDENGQPTIEE